jgi:hypothetical protein
VTWLSLRRRKGERFRVFTIIGFLAVGKRLGAFGPFWQSPNMSSRVNLEGREGDDCGCAPTFQRRKIAVLVEIFIFIIDVLLVDSLVETDDKNSRRCVSIGILRPLLPVSWG